MRTIELGSVANVIMGQSPPGDTYNAIGFGLPFFQGKSEFGRVNPIPVKWCSSPTKVAKCGDILISVRAPVGPTNLADQECCIGRGLAAVRPIPTLVNADYLLLHLRFSEKDLAKKGQGSTFDAISGDDLKKLPIRIAELDAQFEIAAQLNARLSEVEIARQSAYRQVQDIALLRKRLLGNLFASLEDAPRKVLSDYAPTTSGSTPPRGNKRYWEPAEIPWVKTGEVAFTSITKTSESISKLALAECSLTLLPPKSVLVAMIGQGKTRGQSALLEIAATTNQNCFAVLPNDTWVPEFLFYWFVANYENLRSLSADRGGSQSALNGALMNALEIPAPDRVQQLTIVRRVEVALRELGALYTSVKTTINELELLPHCILAKAFES